MVMCWLLNSVSEELRLYLLSAETAHEVWEDLRRRFAPSPELKIYQLRKRIAMMRQDGDSIIGYLKKLHLAWEELWEYVPMQKCVCGSCRCEISKRAIEARDKEKNFSFLIGSNNHTITRDCLIHALNVDWKIHQLRQRIAMASQGCSLAGYFTKLNTAWQELSEYDPLPDCTCGGCRCEAGKRATEAREKEKLFGFLIGLDNKLNKLVTEIRLMKPLPSLNQAYSLLVNWTSTQS